MCDGWQAAQKRCIRIFGSTKLAVEELIQFLHPFVLHFSPMFSMRWRKRANRTNQPHFLWKLLLIRVRSRCPVRRGGFAAKRFAVGLVFSRQLLSDSATKKRSATDSATGFPLTLNRMRRMYGICPHFGNCLLKGK